MLSLPGSPKIRPDHLDRQAFVYVRQSTLVQVRENLASKARQYDLVQRAFDLGWPRERVVLIDQDQGRSGASAVARDGFQFLVAQVGMGHAGAVLCLEASRLARSCSDWYRLLEICALTDTLVIDEESVYHPSQYNDRLLLGFKGTMSEAELHWLRNRLQGGKLKKAQEGQLRSRLPTGLVYTPTNKVAIDPDQQVQQTVRLVFDIFDHSASALAVVKHFATHQLLFPTRSWGGAYHDELTWRPLHLGRVLAVLHNPAYAGAYVYGRTHTRTYTLPSEEPRIKGRTRRVAHEDWPIVLQEAHPAYITWEQFLRNQQRLADNCTLHSEDHRGVAREGTALLQGIVHCGRCGQRMSVRYLKDGTTPCYICAQTHTHFATQTCQSILGIAVDAAIARIFLEAVQPAQLQVSLATLDQLHDQAHHIEQQWHLRIERARYEADLARRRFYAVEPENRLVARTLEREWNERLAQIEQLEHDFAALPKPAARLASPEQRQRILALAQDLPVVWHASTTTHAERKQLLRFLIKDVTLTRCETSIHIGVRWQTAAITELNVPRPLRAPDARRTNPSVVDRVRQLAPQHTDRQIADTLNEEKLLSGTGGPFTVSKVKWIRYAHHIPNACPEAPTAHPNKPRSDGHYSVKATAQLLNVDISTVARWCRTGHLEAVQTVPHGPRWIKLTPEIISKLRKPVRQRWLHRSPK